MMKYLIHKIILSVLFVGSVILAQSASILWENSIENDRYHGSSILKADDGGFLVTTGDMKTLKIDSNGNLVGLLNQIEGNAGFLNSIEKYENIYIGHGGSSGYNIFINAFDENGEFLSYNTVSEGQSGTGDIVIDDSDVYMAWASNCCGQGQTWDTELKKFNQYGISQELSIDWNTDLCFSCDASLGGCSQGLDYPADLALVHSNLVVSGWLTDEPCTNHGYLNIVNKDGDKLWDYTERSFTSRYFKSIQTESSNFIVIGEKGEPGDRSIFASKFDIYGDLIWTTFIEPGFEIRPTDILNIDDSNVLLYGISDGGIYYAKISLDGNVISEGELGTYHAPMMTDYGQPFHNQVVQISPSEFVGIYSYGQWYDETNFSLVSFTIPLPVNGCTNPYASNYDANASVDNGNCIFEENNFSQMHTVYSWDNDISDYQVLFEVDFIEGMSFDYTDILFVDMSNNVLPSFVESYDQNSAKIWVKTNVLTANVQNEILMFYGNSNFQNDNDPNDVFISYENFDNNNFSGSWTVNTQGGASYQFEDGKLKLNVTQTDNFVSVDSESNYSLAEGVALSAKVKVQNSRGHFALGIADGNSKERTNNGGYNFLNGFTFGTGNGGPANFRAINGGQAYDGNAGGSESAIANDFVELEINKLSNQFLNFHYNDSNVDGTADPSFLNTDSHPLYIWLNGWDGQSKTAWIDELKLRKHVSPEPSVNMISGCTDPYANNFNSDANVDDGSCDGYPGNENISLQFDGVDDFVSFGTNPDIQFNDNFSITSWFKINSFDNDLGAIISKATPDQVSAIGIEKTLGQNKISFWIGDGSNWNEIRTPELQTGLWYFLAATNDGSTSRLYLNGDLVSSGLSAFPNSPTGDLRIGVHSFINEDRRFWNGLIDNVSIWGRLLSEEDILNIYSSDLSNNLNGLVANWTFNENDGGLIYDRSGNQNHGTIYGPVWSEDVYVPPIPPIVGGNNSLSFDGVDDYISLNQFNRAGGNDLTINVYAKGQGTMTCPRTPEYESYFGYAVNDSRNQIFFHMGVMTPYSGFNWDVYQDYSNEYHFYSIVLDDLQNGSTLAKLYVDGVSIGQHTYPYSIQSFSEMEIGRNIVEQNGLYSGNISEIQFWDRILSVQEIQYHMLISPEGNEEDLFAFWNFNEGQGTTLTDLSGSGNDGTINGATWTGDAPKVGCMDPYANNYDPLANVNSRFCYGYPENGDHSLSFGSNQDHVDLGSNMDSDDKFSITTWVYIDESIIPLNGQRTFINKVNSENGNKSIFLGSYQSKIGFTVLTGQQSNIMYGSDNQNGSLALTQTPLVSGWQHVGAVFTGDSMLVYINGILDQNVVVFDGPGLVNDYENSVWHIADVLGGSGNVGGKISEMNLWNTALKQNQIQQLMYESPDNLSAGLMGSWKFSEGDGDLLYDHSGNGNHGSILGATWNSDVPYIGPEWFVSTDGDDSNIGSLEQPFLTIQKAINSAGDGHLVSVLPGTYYENINYNGKNILIISEVGPDQTIIDGGQNGSVVTFNTNETDGAAIDGFTITNGYTNENGGGIFIDGASPGIYNVIVENNYANSGGGIDLKGESNSIISNSIVRNNLAEWGAGIYFHSNSPTVENVVVSGNHATTNAGGVYARDNSFPVITNCTIVNNSTDGEGGGILTWFNSLVDVKNSIIRDNYPTEIGHVTGGAVNLNYSNISTNHQGFTGSNNINEDPKFCNQSNDDFRLAQDSPCMGAGEFGNDIGAMFDGDYCEQSFVNNSLSFNGIDNYVTLSSNENIQIIDNEITFTAWVKIPSDHIGNQYSTIIGGRSGFGFTLWAGGSFDNGAIRLNICCDNPSEVSGNFDLRDDQWHFISVVYDGSKYRIYVDGNLDAESNEFSTDLTVYNGDDDIKVGIVNHENANEYFHGQLDEIGFWNKALTNDEIINYSISSLNGNENGLVGYWNFNEGQGSTLTDLTGNDNNGTIYGASWNNYGAPISSSNDDNNEPDINANLTGSISNSADGTNLEGAHVIAISEDNSFTAETFSDENGSYSLGLVGSLNYFVNISFDGLIDHDEYLYIGPFEDTYLNVSLDLLEDALVEGTVTDWYTNAPLASASVLLAYTDEEMITIESTTDEDGYFMVQVPGEEDYDLFVYSDGYWVEHDALYLSSGEHQVLNVGIAEMSAASRLYGTVRDFDTDELIPYAEIQLNCEQASDWDHTGELGTYRVFNYYPGDCDDGVLVVTANGYETSVQSVGNIEFEAGSSYDLDIALVQGNDPDPGMLSGTVYSNIDGSTVSEAEIVAYNVSTTQLFSIQTSNDGSYQLFLPESDYYISVNANDHEDYLDTLTIISGQSITKDFYLDEMYLNTVSGLITDLSGNPLFDIEVYVLPAGADYAINSTFTNENGEYSLQVPNGAYDFGAGNNGYYMSFEYAAELFVNDLVIDFNLTPVSEFDGGIAGIVHLNDGDDAAVWINVWKSDLTYQAYVSPDEGGAYTLPLVNGEYSMYAWVPGSEYQPVFVPSAFTIEDNVINYDIYFVAPDGPEAPTIVFLEDVPNDQGGQLELAWTPGEPREYEIFPQYSVWRMEGEWNLVATVPYHGFDLYNMIVPTIGDSTSGGIFESMFMVTAHTLDQNTFFDSDPVAGYSIDNIFPAIPQQLMARVEGESVELDWNISPDEDFSYYNVYRQDQSSLEVATIFETENNYYSDNNEIDGDYQYWVTAVDVSGNESDPSEPAMVTLGVQEDLMPMEYALMQNYPNPFNPSTQIMYSLPKTSSVKIIIYDMLGSKIRTLYSGVQDAGYKNILWNATNENGDPVSAGMYIYTIEAESFFASKKMILLK